MAYTDIDKPTDYFNTKLYTGDGTSNQAVTGVGFQPDFTWIKIRSSGHQHTLIDSVRGVNKGLLSNSTAVEDTDDQYGWLSSFDSDGFTTQDGSATDHWNVNKTSETYASWNWLAGGSASSNSDGSITSSVSANQTAGFSIVSYTGNATSGATVGHGLGTTPSMIIAKNRSATGNWRVYHKSLGANYLIQLDLTGVALDNATWNDTAPTSSVFSISSVADVNGSGNNIIAYCFAEKKGYSKFGSYTGNGNADGTFVYTGFKPAFVLLKNADEVEQWWIFDNKRNAYDGNFRYYSLNPNHSSAEGTNSADANHIDFLSNGFKLRTTAQQLNGTSDNFIYMAFAESPFVNSNGVPNNAE